MSSPVTALTDLAVNFFRAQEKHAGVRPPFDFGLDPIASEAASRSFLVPEMGHVPGLQEAVEAIFQDSDLEYLRSREGELDPFVMHAGGGVRVSDSAFVTALLGSARARMFLLRLPEEEGEFARLVIEGFSELRRAARHEPVSGTAFFGFSGLSLSEDVQVATPWGVLRAAPPVTDPRSGFHPFRPTTTMVLSERRLLTVQFSRAAEPEFPEFDNEVRKADETAMQLFPLAWALASEDQSPVAPVLTWSTATLPFVGSTGFSSPQIATWPRPTIDVSDRVQEFERWAHAIHMRHTANVDIAARRIVSAISHRLDLSDALIDSVMAWENLVGTSLETTFRVTAALAKLLVQDPSERSAFRGQLSEIYGIRSRVVHGNFVAPKDVEDAAKKATNIAIASLKAAYERGGDWLALNSTQRADRLLLEEP